MLILHLRTVAFICSLSTTIQSILWITGYILYMISYSCGYPRSNFEATFSNDSISLADSFILYFQGSDCQSQTPWITYIRGQNPEILVGLISTGFGLNVALLVTSIVILIALNNDQDVRLYSKRIQVYTISIYLVSFWDGLLVGFIGADIAPLLKSIELPSFTAVACITLMLLSRFLVVWIVNILLATYLLFKKGSDSGSSLPAPTYNPSNYEINKTWNHGTIQNLPVIPEGEKEYFSRNNGLARRIVPPAPPEDPPDEVPLRWTQFTGNFRHDDYSSYNEDTDVGRHRKTSSNLSHDNTRLDKVNWSDAEMHVQNSTSNWKYSSQRMKDQPLNGVSVQDVQQPSPEQKHPSFLKNIKNSFRKKPPDISSTNPMDEEPQEAPIKTIDGFSYLPKANPFNVKLRHVNRLSLSEESNKKGSDNSVSSGGEELFYKVSTVTDRDDLYIPRVPPVPKEPAPLYSRASQDSLKHSSKDVTPPVPPPIKQSSNNNAKKQLSLEEAIRTRGPLRPVNRPAIDTTC